jgi:hypothetical protein
MTLGSAWDGSAWLTMVWDCTEDCTELRGASDDVFRQVKPKNFNGEPARQHCRTHRGG